MNNSFATLLLLGLVCGLWLCANGDGANQDSIATLHERFAVLNKAIGKQFPERDYMSDHIEFIGEFRGDASMAWAVNLIKWLDSNAKKCEPKVVPHLQLAEAAADSNDTWRISSTVFGYRLDYNHNCRELYGKGYVAVKDSIEHRRLVGAFATLKPENLIKMDGQPGPIDSIYLVGKKDEDATDALQIIREPVLYLDNGYNETSAVQKIAEQVSKMTEDDHTFYHVLTYAESSKPEQKLKGTVDRYVIDPCKRLHSKAKELAAFIELVRGDKNSLMNNSILGRASVEFRICELLLKDKDESRKKIGAALAVVMKRTIAEKQAEAVRESLEELRAEGKI